MLIGGILLGLLLGLVLGGKIERLADIRLRFLPLLFVAVIIRFGTEAGALPLRSSWMRASKSQPMSRMECRARRIAALRWIK